MKELPITGNADTDLLIPQTLMANPTKSWKPAHPMRQVINTLKRRLLSCRIYRKGVPKLIVGSDYANTFIRPPASVLLSYMIHAAHLHDRPVRGFICYGTFMSSILMNIQTDSCGTMHGCRIILATIFFHLFISW